MLEALLRVRPWISPALHEGLHTSISGKVGSTPLWCKDASTKQAVQKAVKLIVDSVNQ
jgi:hypothetical protein